MNRKLRVLLLACSEDDQLLLSAIRWGDYAPVYTCVNTTDSLIEALRVQAWDVIIASVLTSSTDKVQIALALKSRNLTVPVILVSSSQGAEGGVKAISVGDQQYLKQDSLTRLVLVLDRAMREADERRERQEAQEKLMEAQLQQTQKLESIGLLAGGIAHDLNNLLTTIMGYVDLGLVDLPPDDPLRDDLKQICTVARRGVSLTRQLQSIARHQTLLPRIFNLNALIRGMEDILRPVLGPDVTLQTQLAPELGVVRADYEQLEHVLINLAVNARDAMPLGGKLTVTTADVLIDDDAHRFVDIAPGAYVVIIVSDTGAGMDDEVQQRLFEPFFTTKEQCKGAGLGLATCYSIVRQHGGSIMYDSILGQGTRFNIYLPRYTASSRVLSQLEDDGTRVRGNELVLVVEDERSVRALTSRVLREQGYVVLEARDGTEALQMIEERIESPIQLILTDVIMPGVDGLELAERALVICPGIKIVFTSGYLNGAPFHPELYGTNVGFLPKPFSLSELERKVREVLDGPCEG